MALAGDRLLMGDPRSLHGKIALITGAGDGMGRATAQLFARDGAKVAVTDVNGDAAEAVAAALRAEGAEAHAWALDVADAAAIVRVVAQLAERLGGLDIVVNNAGIARPLALEDPAYDDLFDRYFRVMLSAHQRVVRAALPWLRASAHPRVVNIASTEALGATPRNSAYGAIKAGVVGLTRGLAVELGRDGITVNCVCPGPVLTSMTAPIPDEDKAIYARRRTALGRYGTPEEIAHITMSLCLPAASFITGAVIPVDGGLTARIG